MLSDESDYGSVGPGALLACGYVLKRCLWQANKCSMVGGRTEVRIYGELLTATHVRCDAVEHSSCQK